MTTIPVNKVKNNGFTDATGKSLKAAENALL